MNANSLKGTEWFEQAENHLKEAGMKLHRAEKFSKTKELLSAVQEESERSRLIIVGGGDGTLSAAANILVKTDSVLGVLPLGTGNAFARDLKIPTSAAKAAEVITTGKVVKVDLGSARGRYFLNVVSIGLSAEAAKTLTVPLKRKMGRFVYAFALRQALRETKPFHVVVETNEGTAESDAVQLVIGNGRYHAGPLLLSPGASITDGQLLVYVVDGSALTDLVKYAMLLPTGLQGLLKTVKTAGVKSGRVFADPGQDAVADGEVIGSTPFDFMIHPQALPVMVPASFKG